MPRRNIFPRLKGELENRIHQLSPGDMLPGENALAAEFGVSRPYPPPRPRGAGEGGVIGRRNGVGTVVRSVPGAIRRELPFVCGSIDFFSAAMEHFCRRAVELNYFPMVIPLAGNAVAQERLMAGILERRPAGIVIYPDPGHPGLAAFRELERSGIPTLYLVRLPEGVRNANLLEFGNAAALSRIVQELYRRGCRKFALYGDDVHPAAAAEREEGFRLGMRRCRLAIRPELCCLPESSTERRDAFCELFRDPGERPDAVCCMNDQSAANFLTELRRRGISSDGLAISGVDNLPLLRLLPETVLTADLRQPEFGRKAAEMIVGRIENPGLEFQHVKFRARFLTGGGMGSLPA
ncbi:MAG: substrate-binding domain-containing protein [Lentisphaeria bacterium]|nr:MAG: substrate-binding domain-containing protein [Lentisphaeria bacterium]